MKKESHLINFLLKGKLRGNIIIMFSFSLPFNSVELIVLHLDVSSDLHYRNEANGPDH